MINLHNSKIKTNILKVIDWNTFCNITYIGIQFDGIVMSILLIWFLIYSQLNFIYSTKLFKTEIEKGFRLHFIANGRDADLGILLYWKKNLCYDKIKQYNNFLW